MIRTYTKYCVVKDDEILSIGDTEYDAWRSYVHRDDISLSSYFGLIEVGYECELRIFTKEVK